MRRSLVFAALLIPAVASAGFRVSSFKKETKLGANTWNAASALDSHVESCWMVDPESENVGEWFELDLPRSEVDKLGLIVGWGKDESTFKDYARVKSAKVEIFGDTKADDVKVGEATVTFEDKPGMQIVELPDTKVGGEITGGKLKITVTEVYPGEDYPNLAVSEILAVLKETDVPAGVTVIKTPPAEAPGHDAMMLLDGSPTTFWSAPAGESLEMELRAEGYGLSSVGILPAPLASTRPKTVEVTVNDYAVTVSLPEPKAGEKLAPVWVNLPSVVGYTGSAWGNLHVKVIDTWAPAKDPNVAIAEIKLRYTNYEAL